MTEPSISERIPQILEALNAADGKFPRQAILDARECREAITPELLRIIHDEFDFVKKGNPPSDVRSLIVFFILLEFRTKELLPILVEILHQPDPVPYDFFGDIITEDIAKILRYLGVEEAVLDSLIRGRNADEYVRWEALQCLAFFVKDGRWSREELCARLHSYLKEALETEDKNLIFSLISELVDCGAMEAQDDIDLAFERNMIDFFMYRRSQIPESLKEGADHFAKRLEDLNADYSDCIVEIEQWCCFGEDKPEPLPGSLPSYAQRPNRNGLFGDFDEERPRAKVGRNDPCPCGSGKKYKKCCMK